MPPTRSTSPDGRYTYTAGAAITKNTAVKYGTDDRTVVPVAAATEAAVGVALDDADAGRLVPVLILGVGDGTVILTATGTVARAGQVNALGGPAATGNQVIGRALNAAVAGQPIELAHNVAHPL